LAATNRAIALSDPRFATVTSSSGTETPNSVSRNSATPDAHRIDDPFGEQRIIVAQEEVGRMYRKLSRT